MTGSWTLLACLILLLGTPSSCEPMASSAQAQFRVTKLRPIDEAGRDPSFVAFRSRLLKAIANRDKNHLKSVIHPIRRSTFPGLRSSSELNDTWRSPKPNLFEILEFALSHGGTWESKPNSNKRNMFVAPYYYTRFPDMGTGGDIHSYMLVLDKNVALRSSPSASSQIIERLNNDVVLATGIDSSPKGWMKVQLASGSEGYVSSKYLGYPYDYRIGFEKKNGKWYLMWLEEGE